MRSLILILGLQLLIPEPAKTSEVTKAIAVTVLNANLIEQTVLAKTLDGKQQVFRFTSKTPVTSLAQAGINRNLHGGAGYQFILYYRTLKGEKVVTEFHYVGREDWNEEKGNLVNVDLKARTIVLRTENDQEELLVAGENCAIQSPSGARPFNRWISENDIGKPAILRYTVVNNGKVAHLVELL